MRRTLSAAVTTVVAVTLAGCQSTATTINTTPASTSAAAATHVPAKAAPTTSAVPKKAGIGAAIDLKDSTGDSIQVTLVKIVDPAKSTNEFLTPDAGARYVAVQFRIVNKGSAVYSQDPQLEAKAKDALGEAFAPELAAITSAGVAMDPGLKLAPGDTALGFLTFQVPDGKKITQVQYSVSLFGGSVAQWTIG